MGSKKTTTSTTQQAQSNNYNNANTYGWQQQPETADVSNFRNFTPQVDPSIAYGAAASRTRAQQNADNQLGGYQTGTTRQAALNTANQNIDQNASQAFRQGSYDVNQQKMAQLGTLASLTAPRLVETSSSGTSQGTGTGSGTTSQNTPALDNILGGASAGIDIASLF